MCNYLYNMDKEKNMNDENNMALTEQELQEIIEILKYNKELMDEDGRFYQEDENGDKKEVHLSLNHNIEKNSSNLNLNYKQVPFVKDISYENEKINVFKFFEDNINDKYIDTVKRKIYENFEISTLKKVEKSFKEHKKFFSLIIYGEYIKTYQYVYSFIFFGENIFFDEKRNKMLLEKNVKETIEPNDSNLKIINKENFEKNFELILSSILNYSENINLLTEKVYSDSSSIEEEFLLTQKANQENIATGNIIGQLELALKNIEETAAIILEKRTVVEKFDNFKKDILSKYNIDKVINISKNILKKNKEEYNVLLKNYFNTLSTEELFQYIIENEFTEKSFLIDVSNIEVKIEQDEEGYLQRNKWDDDNYYYSAAKKRMHMDMYGNISSEDIDEYEEVENSMDYLKEKYIREKIKKTKNQTKEKKEYFEIGYLNIYLDKVKEKIKLFDSHFLSKKTEKEQMSFIDKLIKMVLEHKGNKKILLESKEVMVLAGVIKDGMYLILKNAILDFNKKVENNSFANGEMNSHKELLQYYRDFFEGANKTFVSIISELALLENISLTQKVKDENIHKITVDRGVFENVFSALKPLFEYEKDMYDNYSKDKKYHIFNNLEYIVKENEISFLIKLDKEVTQFFDKKELFKKLKLRLEGNHGGKESKLVEIVDGMFAEEILQAKLKFNDSKKESSEIKREIKPRTKI